MGEPHEVLEREGAGAALDRMDGAEHGVDRFRILVAALDGQQTGLQVAEQGTYGPSSFRTTASWMCAASTIWSIGTDSLAAWPCAPEPGPKLTISMPS